MGWLEKLVMYRSVKNKTWRIKEVAPSEVSRFMQKFAISEIEARLLLLREVKEEMIEHFLDPKLRNLMPDPYHLLDMDKAVDRAVDAIGKGEAICIFGDYDVDGATSSALLRRMFNALSADVQVYIPDRMKEGYGPTSGAMDRIKQDGSKLVITVDCGAMAFEAIDHAVDIGLDVIVIDHHIGAEKLPKAVAVINPNRLDEQTSYKYLAAVGVSFLFAIGLVARLREKGFFKNREEPNLMEYLDLVALGTVCDVMPLIGLNRAFVKQGLKILAQRKNIGLKTLADIACLDSLPTTYHLGFLLGPRINAGGRVGESHLGSLLLSTNCEIEALEIAKKLEDFNLQRRAIEAEIVEEAIQLAEAQAENNFIMISGYWHPGVIGIVAGKLKEIHQRPVAVVSMINGVGKASCRSINGIDFGSKLAEAKLKGLIEVGGGHAMAAGFTVSEDRLEKLKEFLEEEFGKYREVIEDNRTLQYDLELTSDGVSIGLHDQIDSLAPFGNGNPEPTVKVDGLFVLKAYIVGEKHISCLLASDRSSYQSKAIRAIAFNAVGTAVGDALLSPTPKLLSVIGYLKIQHRNGDTYPQLVINDLLYQVPN